MKRTAFIVAFAALLLGGCGSLGDGAKIVEGTDLTFGVQLPYADTTETMAVVNYLTGFRVSVAENARCHVKYSCFETNSYFGVITTRVGKTIDAKVEPTVDPDDEEEDPDDEEDRETTSAK